MVCIIVTLPTLHDDVGFLRRVEDLAVKQLVPQTRVEALEESVFPRAFRRDVGRLRADSLDPVLFERSTLKVQLVQLPTTASFLYDPLSYGMGS